MLETPESNIGRAVIHDDRASLVPCPCGPLWRMSVGLRVSELVLNGSMLGFDLGLLLAAAWLHLRPILRCARDKS
jgi:hypothetical protein